MSQTAADICRERGWEKGTLLQERYAFNGRWYEMVFRITAIGESAILARPLGERNELIPEWKLASQSEYLFRQFVHGMTAIDRLPWEVPNDAA